MKIGVMLFFAVMVACAPFAAGDEKAAAPDGLFRTDSSHPELPWYQLKAGEFPPVHSEHQIAGELTQADFIHRTGQFRDGGTGELVNFTLLPYSLVYYLNAEADLRDIPLGTHLHFFLYQDEKRAFTRAVVIQDDFTAMARQGAAGTDAQSRATEAQRKKHTAFLKARGLPAQIERCEGKQMVITFFGDPAGLQALFKDERITPEQWAQQHRHVKAAVANLELRTYNPPVDNQSSALIEVHQTPTDRYGTSGIQWTIQPNLLLEGFRKGRVIRVFASPSWPIEDMPFGESLYTERPGAKMEEESTNQYPYRTDFGNENLPWYRLKAGEFPPFQSQHVMTGELLKIDAAHRSGQFRADRTGEVVDFKLPPFGAIRYLSADAELGDLPLGTRFSFSLYQDAKGAFTQAAVLEDEFSRLASEKLTCRVESVRLDEGRIFVANQLALMKDDKDHTIRPPDLGHEQYAVDEKTRVWKGEQRIALSDLAEGDDLLLNLSASTTKSPSRCTDIWVGLETHKLASSNQRARHKAFLRQNGLPAWIESVNGNTLTLTFFAGDRREFFEALDGDPNGQNVSVQRVDDELHPMDAPMETMKFRTHPREQNTAGTYGSAGVWWILDAKSMPAGFEAGRVIRVFKIDWLIKAGKK